MIPPRRRPDGASPPVTRSWGPALKAIWLLWITYGVVSAMQIYVTWRLEGMTPARWYGPAFVSLAKSSLWALATPWIIRLARRHPVTQATLMRALGVHVASALVLSVLDAAADTGLLMLMRENMSPNMLVTAVGRLDLVFLYYGGIVLGTRLWDVQSAVQEREVRAARLETELAESRIELLNRQIAPHFLFNSLNVVSSFLHRDVDRADDVLMRLSEMLRRSLGESGAPMVPLGEELEALEPYLEIQRSRHEWLEVVHQIEPDARRALVPNMLLQPIVENAILHGLEPAERVGTLTLRGRVRDFGLEILVEDDGVGLPELEEPALGVGLRNVRARLEHLYGDEASVRLEDRSGQGARVRVRLPLAYGDAAVVAAAVDGSG